jgi:hypothetical protein
MKKIKMFQGDDYSHWYDEQAPMLIMDGKTVSMSDLLDKTLIAAKDNVNIRSYASTKTGKIISKANKGDVIGQIYSWVSDKDGGSNIWLAIDRNGKPYGYVRSDMTNYNVKSLREQGVKTIEENIEAEKEKKEEEEKTFFDKLQEGLFKYGKIVGIILIVGIIIYFVLLNFGSIKSSLKTK